MFVFSAAGFIATSTLGASPGVRMSWSAKWTWKPETPGSEPAGARISAGKSGSVDRSFPSTAVSLVKRPPVSCMPSPESPANLMMTRSSSWTGLVILLPRGIAHVGGVPCRVSTLGGVYFCRGRFPPWCRLLGTVSAVAPPLLHDRSAGRRDGIERRAEVGEALALPLTGPLELEGVERVPAIGHLERSAGPPRRA